MKRNLLIFQFVFLTQLLFAQLNGDGFYRVKNVGSERYITVRDNRGSVNIATTSADMGAVELYKGFENVVSDPSSVLYISETSSGYKFYSQGTDTYEIIGYYLRLKQNSDGSYKAYQGNSMMVMYLGDSETTSVVDGKLATNAKGKYRDWYILPVSSSSDDNFFGVKPEVKTSNGYYASFYASFPFETVSESMSVFYIDKVNHGMAVFKELKGGVVPTSTPVFIKCDSDNPSDNRLNIVSNNVSALQNNQMSGVYFCNDNKAHYNQTPYNPETMRILGIDSNGELAFVKADYDFLPANKSYLTVPVGSPDVIKVVSYDEYLQAVEDLENPTKYVVTYKIGNDVISSDTLLAGSPIVTPTAPVKTGYTFEGWSNVPDVMPAEDLVIQGSYRINSYLVTFKVGSTVISSEKMPYGSAIVAPELADKEGHSFMGWNNLLETVPAYNVTFYGSYAINSYKLQYIVDGNVYQSMTLEYGSPISLIAYPEKEGYTFSGWSEAPKSMPAHDLSITGSFIVNVYNVYYYVSGELVHTEKVAYGDPIPEYQYKPSDSAVSFLGWIGEKYDLMPPHDVTYTANLQSGIDEVDMDINMNVDIYTLMGVKIMSGVSFQSSKDLLKRGVYIVNGKKVVVE